MELDLTHDVTCFFPFSFSQQKLTELRQWSEKVRNFDRNFISENGMFFLDCSAIHEGLLPRLNDIYQELITFVADEAKNLAANFVDEMKVIAKVRALKLSRARLTQMKWGVLNLSKVRLTQRMLLPK